MGGRLLADKLKGSGNIAALYTQGQPNLEQRLDGYKSIIAMHPGMKLVDTADLKGDPTAAFDTAEALLNKSTPKIDAAIALRLSRVLRIAEIIKRDNKKLVFIAAGRLYRRPWMRSSRGWITASVAQKPFTMGYVGLRMMADQILYKVPSITVDFRHDPNSLVPEFVGTGVGMADQSNLKIYRDALK